MQAIGSGDGAEGTSFVASQRHPGVEPTNPMLVLRNNEYPLSLGTTPVVGATVMSAIGP